MNAEFCSILAAEEGEPIYGTAPEKDSAIFLPAHKSDWHRTSPKERLAGLAKNTDLSQTIHSFERPLAIYYSPNEQSENYIWASGISGINCFSSSGLKIEKEVKQIYAVCTDGIKDACCAKFGIPVARSFSKESRNNEWTLTLETSHIGGCRFSATAVCFPSGNSYGRIPPEAVKEIINSEENGLIVSKYFRGNIFVSEIHCWIMRHSMEHFGYVPTPNQTQVVREGNLFLVTITPNKGAEFKFYMIHNQVELNLFSGCSNIDSGRTIKRSIYDFRLATYRFE